MRTVPSRLIRELFTGQLRVHLDVLLHCLDVSVPVLEVRRTVFLERWLLVRFHAVELGAAFRCLCGVYVLVDEINLSRGVLVLELPISSGLFSGGG